MNIQSEFENYLIARGYRIKTPNGKPSTVSNYINSINIVCKEENCSWEDLTRNIYQVCEMYDKRGIKRNIGAKSNNTVINALKQYKKFCYDFCSI